MTRARAVLVLIMALLPAATARADRTVSARLAWLPGEVQSALGAVPAGAPLMKWIVQAMVSDQPDCWAKQVKSVEQTFQLWRAPGDGTTMMLHGRLDRSAIERCMLEVLPALARHLPPMGISPKLARQGAITEVTISPTRRAFVGWSGRWAIWHEDRAWVERLLVSVRRPRPDHARLRELLDRIRIPPDHFWAVTLDDLFAAFVGVPSRGFLCTMPFRGAGRELQGAWLFDSPAQAQEASRALKQSGQSPKLASEIKAVIARMQPRVQGDSLEFALDGSFMADPAFLNAAEAQMKVGGLKQH
jgi:hypothetical protein